jgi:hypothetical protein
MNRQLHPRESTIVTSILRYLKAVPDSFAWKEHGGMYGTSGLPDIICCIGGRFVAFEVKTPTGRLSKLQSVTLARINAAKGMAYMVTSVEEVRFLLEQLMEVGNI